ncbi:MAG: hypothetical protein DDT18_01152 [Actinobacteria bacterium]|nr:hypothetical protein [Actinomycetota bacterium]
MNSKKEIKKKIKDWEKEFEKEFPSMFWVGEDPDNVKDFIRQKLEEREKEILERIEKEIIIPITKGLSREVFPESIKMIKEKWQKQLSEY